ADPRAVDPLIAALADPCLEVRRLAIRALGSFGGTRSVGPLLDYQSSHKFSDEIIVDALAKIGQSAVEPLTAALDAPHYSVVGVAAGALGKIRDPRALDPLVAALHKKIHPEIANALDSCGWEPNTTLDAACYWAAKKKWDKCVEIGAPAIEVLTKLVEDHEWPEHGRQEAMKTLARITGTEKTEETIEDTEDRGGSSEPQEIADTQLDHPTEAPPMSSETVEIAADEDQLDEEPEIETLDTMPIAEAPSADIEPEPPVVEAEPQECASPALENLDMQGAEVETHIEPHETVEPTEPQAIARETPKPVSTQMRERVEDIINSRVRPMLRTDGRDIHVVDITEGVVFVNLKCEYTGSDRIPLENAVSARIRDLIEEIVFVKFV
ncbi:MAG TPA: hypothetical protein DCZ69_02355, partial [Syntrophobacteraceae bacterium]|nr:hypothetical protein [Syntrophobacteraceae bacterium]